MTPATPSSSQSSLFNRTTPAPGSAPDSAPPPLLPASMAPPIATAAPSRWTFKAVPTAADAHVGAACGVSAVTAAILRSRGYASADEIGHFFESPVEGLRDPLSLPDIEVAMARLHRAIVDKEPILIFGDYDVDGVTSTALLMRALRGLEANVSPHIPERKHGYGLNIAAVEAARARGISLIVTADCGITAHEPVQRANELGMDVIVTDHHNPGPTLPPALAVINPKRADSVYGFRELSGCGVAFKVIQALLQRHWPRHAARFLERFVDLVGLAAIADCVPLTDENRILARLGLHRLAQTNKCGLQALIKSSRLRIEGDSLVGRHVSFNLAPRLNAVGRMDSAFKAYQLLMSSDLEECESLAAELEGHNRARQEITTRILDEATEFIRREVDLERHFALVVAGENWNKGIVGLVASRLVERHSRPAIVLNIDNGVAHGSGRSIEGFDLHAMIEASRDLLESGGGHRVACGLSLKVENLPKFRERVLQIAGEQLTPEHLMPGVEADCLVSGADVTKQLARELESLEPCGNGNPEARLLLPRARIIESRRMGKEDEHLKWFVDVEGRSFEAVWWRPGEKAAGLGAGKIVDLCFVPEINCYKDKVNLQLNIKEARPHAPLLAPA